MGRPIQKKYFANTNYELSGFANVGGEGVASVAIASPIAKSYTAAAVATFSAPQLTNGQTATGTVTIDGSGDIAAIVMTSAGSGYTSRPTVTISEAAKADTVLTHGSDGVTTTLTTTRQNSIKCEAQVGSGSEVLTGDVIKQVGSRRYKVTTSDGTAVCKLVVTNALSANEMSIMATDVDGGTYLVSKLTARKAVLVPLANTHGGTTSAGAIYTSGQTAKWTFGSAADGIVSINNQ